MTLDTAPWSLILAPALLVIGTVYVLPGAVPVSRPWVRYLVAFVIWAIALRYLWWRITETLVLHNGWPVAAWSLFCLGVEVVAMLDTSLLYMTFMRPRDRRAEADAHERRLRALPENQFPKVDVYIATYNESLAVLEKTIVGALSLDWPNLAVYVLDDGRRPWLRKYCEEKGAGYINRPDNKGAKAGNINHALKLTDGEYVAIFDADFVPQRSFLMRAMGFFEDPGVGIVQIPHTFYNHDPMQANLAMRKAMPDDQRFFFEVVMPNRDGWDAAFCCGSNSVTRRVALDSVGGALPEDTITEDILLTMVLLRQGYVTRYLCEPLALGLAPESVSAFFVQRLRWARGAIQMLYVPAGPLGPGLRLAHRLLFFPGHWLTTGLVALMSLLIPLGYLLFDLPPMEHVGIEAALHYMLPMLLAMLGGLSCFAHGKIHPLASQVLSTFQSFKLIPTVLTTLVRPRGHVFKVTPKGADAASGYERGIFLICAALIIATLVGVAINIVPEWRRVDDTGLIPIVAFWCAVNVAVLFLVSMLCLQMPVRRGEERFDISEPIMVRRPGGGGIVTLMSEDISLTGLGLEVGEADLGDWRSGDAVEAYISEVGWTRARVARVTATLAGLRFEEAEGLQHDLLIRKLFTGGRNTVVETMSGWRLTLELLKRIVVADMEVRADPAPDAPPALPEDKLPQQSFVVSPSERANAFADALEQARRAA